MKSSYLLLFVGRLRKGRGWQNVLDVDRVAERNSCNATPLQAHGNNQTVPGRAVRPIPTAPHASRIGSTYVITIRPEVPPGFLRAAWQSGLARKGSLLDPIAT